MHYIIASLVTILAPIFWIGTLLGLPGNWGLVLIAGLLVYFAQGSVHDVSPGTFASIVALALAGEIAEFIAGALGVQQLGGSKRGTVLAVAGSIIGAVVGMFIGVPIPVIGSLVAAVLFGGVGAFGGAVLGERWAGRNWEDSIQIGVGAFWGKLFGTILKAICGTCIMVLVIIAVWF